MKIKIEKTFIVHVAADEYFHLIFAKYQEGEIVRPKEVYANESNPKEMITIREVVPGGYNFADQTFCIKIEKPAFPFEELEGKIFVKK